MAKQDDFTRYTVRLPAPLYGRVAQAADLARRSVNAEIIAALESVHPAPVDHGREGLAAWLQDGALPELSPKQEAGLRELVRAHLAELRTSEARRSLLRGV